MIEFPRPAHPDPETLHEQIDRLLLGPYCIEWHEDKISLRFDRELDLHETEMLESVVLAHDGSASIAAREKRAAEILAIREASAPLAEEARSKRLRGEALSQAELAALIDFALFGA